MLFNATVCIVLGTVKQTAVVYIQKSGNKRPFFYQSGSDRGLFYAARSESANSRVQWKELLG